MKRRARSVRDAIALAFDGVRLRGRTRRARRGARGGAGSCARRSPRATRREDDVLVDLGLELELELRRRAVARRAVGEVDEVADALDDLTERIEVRAFDVDVRSPSRGMRSRSSRPSSDSRTKSASRSPSSACVTNVVDVGARDRDDRALSRPRWMRLASAISRTSTDAVALEARARRTSRHERTRPPPRGATKPCEVSASASLLASRLEPSLVELEDAARRGDALGDRRVRDLGDAPRRSSPKSFASSPKMSMPFSSLLARCRVRSSEPAFSYAVRPMLIT